MSNGKNVSRKNFLIPIPGERDSPEGLGGRRNREKGRSVPFSSFLGTDRRIGRLSVKGDLVRK